ncbi:hypothetical protein [Roseovarius sp. Pro17]|uniref:hypothetical protein n=1 Tax=Roseovarius sp. Pro17 TaxID=3108175 RepID=UPI002D77856D|nr:hypothetical protein [Roseovarius sp. Pro17]
MPSETVRISCHTHRSMAQHQLVNAISAKLLLDHAGLGIDGVYIHNKPLFLPLLNDQQRISDAMFQFMENWESCVPGDRRFQTAAA